MYLDGVEKFSEGAEHFWTIISPAARVGHDYQRSPVTDGWWNYLLHHQPGGEERAVLYLQLYKKNFFCEF